MKTKEEWSSDVIFDIATRSGILRVEFQRIIEKIQLDAIKEGMRRAANRLEERSVSMNSFTLELTISEEAKAILTAAEQLTEKDL